MVRPILNESSLQNLEERENAQLRPEFNEQMLAFRKKSLSGIKPKILNGKNLNGEMLATLIENYVTAINKGVVPSIESAWNYICKNECGKAFADAQELYEKVIMHSVSVKFPMLEEELHALHKESKQNALDLFRSKAVGADVSRLLEKLKSIILEKYTNLKLDNEAESEKKCNAFLFNAYGTIEQKLRNNEYKTFMDFKREIQKLQVFFTERGPEGPFRNEILLDFCQKRTADTADFFIKQIQNELEFLESDCEDKIKALESSIKESKDEYLRDRSE